MSNENNVIGKNIVLYRNMAKLNQKDLSDLLGISNQRLNNWEKGINKPNAEYIALLCNILNIKSDDLLGLKQTTELTINEVKLLKLYNQLSKASKDLVMRTIEDLIEIENDKTVTIIPYLFESQPTPTRSLDYYPQAAGMGSGQYVKDAIPEKLRVPTDKIPPKTDFIIRVVGDSMEPTFSSGDKLFIQSTDYLEEGDIGVFNIDGEQVVKEAGNGELISHNKEYPPIKTKNCHLVVQGKVLGKL